MTLTAPPSPTTLSDAQRDWLKKVGSVMNLQIGNGDSPDPLIATPDRADSTVPNGLNADDGADGKSARSGVLPDDTISAQPDPGNGKLGVEVELFTKTITKDINYGEFKLTATVKVPPTYGEGGVGATGTSKVKDGKRVQGAKVGMGPELENLKILEDLNITDISVVLESEWSGDEISNQLNFKGTIVTSFFKAPAELKIILFNYKFKDDSVKFPGVELKISPHTFTVKIKGVETKLRAEYRATFAFDYKKVGVKILEKIAKEKLEKEAKKQGVKFLAKQAAEKILTRLGPLVAAFGVGWDIGTFLRKYTAGGDAAQTVMDDILGDLNEQWQKADTLGKMELIVRNRVQIVTALVAAGVVGAGAGIGDLVIFKLMGLDKLKDFGPMFKKFMQVMGKIPKVGDAFSDMQMAAAIKLGIKFNPKYHSISDPSLSTLTRATYKHIKPIYGKTSGLNQLISVRMHDIDVDEAVHRKIAALIQQKKLTYTGLNPQSPTDEITDALLDLILDDYRRFLEGNRLISYKIKISDDLSAGAITQDLVDELFV